MSPNIIIYDIIWVTLRKLNLRKIKTGLLGNDTTIPIPTWLLTAFDLSVGTYNLRLW